MPPENLRDRSDLVLNPGEFAFVQDRSKGNISVNVGPLKTSMSDTESTVIWDNASRRFRPVDQVGAVQSFVSAPDGSYVVLSNPAKGNERPQAGKSTNVIELEQGRRIHMSGPVHFPLWPGEVAKVVEGHQLRSNEYLVVRVYNEEVARKHWKDVVMKQQVSAKVSTDEVAEEVPAQVVDLISGFKAEDLRTGQLIIIRGNEISFFMPQTGIEVVSASNSYVRRAVTLERLEYCILLNEDGQKRYMRGPAVVFPEPTEDFIEKEGEVKFKATELNENSGIYVKVIEDYEEGGTEYKTGDELFITGKETPIYFPRQEHAVIRYGKDKIHFAVAVPKGEGRYVLNRLTGDVSLVIGPVMLLPDPRKEVIVQRVIDPNTVALWYPGNEEAKAHNQNLMALSSSGREDYITKGLVDDTRERTFGSQSLARSAELVGDSMKRGSSFTPPRTVTLNTKYDGAVSVSPWTGFAIQITDKSGKRRVVKGPATALLEYDEVLTLMELLTGTPKTDAKTVKTAYLRVLNNRVSDIVEAETNDLCKVNVKLAYRVNFEGDDELLWFAVENYVRLLTEHCGSRIRNAVKQLGIETFYADPVTIIRDTILGVSSDKGRTGRAFKENGMRVYDVEVIDVSIKNADIASLLTDAQHKAVRETLEIAQAEARLNRTRRLEEVTQTEAKVKDATKVVLDGIKGEGIERDREIRLATAEANAEVKSTEKKFEQELQVIIDAIAEAELARRKKHDDHELSLDKAKLDAEAEALKKRMDAISDKVANALTVFSDAQLTQKLADALAPLAILGNEDVMTIMGRYIEGTPFQSTLDNLRTRSKDRTH